MKNSNIILILVALMWAASILLTYLGATSYFALIAVAISISIITLATIWLLSRRDVSTIYKNTTVSHIETSTSTTATETSPNTLTNRHYDELTTLPTRAFFNEILNKNISQAKRHQKFLAVLLIDLDTFDKINAKHGKQTGDLILKEIAKRFQTAIRTEDILARLEGDEFIILLNDIGKPKFASAVAEKLLQQLTTPINVNNKNISITASIGITIYPTDGLSLEDLLNKADMALYKAKNIIGSNYQFCSQEMTIEAHEFIKLEKDLRNAIANNQLVLYFQPKMHIKHGNINGVEALLRWTHPEHGIINPATFIPLAEETGLIMQIGEWALQQACLINKSWQDEGYEHFTIAVNLSPKQFYHPEIVNIINRILAESKLDPSYLELEISEATVMGDLEAAVEIFAKIKTTGVQLSIDHFGTGYTSISHLKKFPINAVKIDRSYIKGTPFNPNDMAITSAFIALLHNLGFDVVAEGVETAEQVQYLSTLDCDMIQGYYLSQPQPAPKITQQFKKLMDTVMV